MQIFNFLIATLGSAMSLVILVVVLLHYVYLDLKPELARDIPSLWLSAMLFGVMGSLGWLCAWARARDHAYKLWFELGSAVVGGGCVALLILLYR